MSRDVNLLWFVVYLAAYTLFCSICGSWVDIK